MVQDKVDTRARRVGRHIDFVARIEEECARGRRVRIHFAVLRIDVEQQLEAEAIERVLAARMRQTDFVAAFELDRIYEVLLRDLDPRALRDIVAQLEITLGQVARGVRIAGACFPDDGRSPESLLEAISAPAAYLPVEPARRAVAPAAPLADVLGAVERDRIVAALAHVGGNQSHAARLLGISRKVLIARLEAYSLPRPRKRVARGG